VTHTYKGIFVLKVHAKVTRFGGKKILKLPYLDNGPQKLPKYTARFFFFFKLLSSLTCSQIWLIPLADDHQCGCITKLEGNKTRGVSHCGLAIYSDLEAKEELWKLKYFTMQKYNLQKIL
jgi:hypothetical protein